MKNSISTIIVFVFMVLIGSAMCSPVMAGNDGSVSVTLENDLFGKGTDRHYTNGARATIVLTEEELSALPEPLKWLALVPELIPIIGESEDGQRFIAFSAGQEIYTPEDITRADPDPNDRPYAGWSYLSGAVIDRSEDHQDTFHVQGGVVGPSAMAGWTQNMVHRIINYQQAEGWETQGKDKPGVIFSWQRKWRGYRHETPMGFGFEFIPHAGIRTGNVVSGPNAGGQFRFGYNLPDDFGEDPLAPGQVSVPGESDGEFGFQIFGGADWRGVARNLLLDAVSKDGEGLDILPYVMDIFGGATVDIGPVRFTYTKVVRSPEFEGQEESDSHGSFRISVDR